MGQQMNTTLKNCTSGQVVLWRAGIASFRWLLLEVKRKTSIYQVECEVLSQPDFVYLPDGKYAVGKTSLWRSVTTVTVMTEMEVLAWASK